MLGREFQHIRVIRRNKMSWDRFVFNFTGAMYYAILIAWEYIKMAWIKWQNLGLREEN